MSPLIFRSTNQFMPTYDPFAAGASAVRLAFGGGGMMGGMGPIEDRFNQAQEEDQRRRMEEMLRLRGGGFSGIGGGLNYGGAMGSQWMRSMPNLSFPSGGMM